MTRSRQRAGPVWLAARVAAILVAAFVLAAGPGRAGERIVVGSKNFPENRLLAEMFARLIEERTGRASTSPRR